MSHHLSGRAAGQERSIQMCILTINVVPREERLLIGADFNEYADKRNRGYEVVMGKMDWKNAMKGRSIGGFGKKDGRAVENTH